MCEKKSQIFFSLIFWSQKYYSSVLGIFIRDKNRNKIQFFLAISWKQFCHVFEWRFLSPSKSSFSHLRFHNFAMLTLLTVRSARTHTKRSYIIIVCSNKCKLETTPPPIYVIVGLVEYPVARFHRTVSTLHSLKSEGEDLQIILVLKKTSPIIEELLSKCSVDLISLLINKVGTSFSVVAAKISKKW